MQEQAKVIYTPQNQDGTWNEAFRKEKQIISCSKSYLPPSKKQSLLSMIHKEKVQNEKQTFSIISLYFHIVLRFQYLSTPSIQSIQHSFRSGTCGYPKKPGRSGLGGLTHFNFWVISTATSCEPVYTYNCMQSLKRMDLQMFSVCPGDTLKSRKQVA